MGIKVLYFTKYSRKGASSRLRCFQYFPYLESKGIKVDVSTLFGDLYLEKLYAGKRSKLEIIKGYSKRVFKLFSIWKYDKIVIDDELFPYLPAWVEILINKFGIDYIVDYDDATFHNYDLNSNKLIRKFLSDKIDLVMRFSKTVVAGNAYLAGRAKLAGAKNIEIIPTVIDLKRYHVVEKITSSEEFIIGWIGSKSTYKYLIPLKEVFQNIAKKNRIKIHLIGVDDNLGLPELVTPIQWTEATEVAAINKFDIGIMPLNDTPWEKGKCSYKLIQYMACGLPVVASSIGMNKMVVQNNGFLVEKIEDWQISIENYIHNIELRNQHGQLGRLSVEKDYSLQATQEKWFKIITS